MPPRRKINTMPAPKKGAKLVPKIDEIKFDRDARSEYLTGFHKRKLQRIKAAKEAAEAVDKVAKVDARKQVRALLAPVQSSGVLMGS